MATVGLLSVSDRMVLTTLAISMGGRRDPLSWFPLPPTNLYRTFSFLANNFFFLDGLLENFFLLWSFSLQSPQCRWGFSRTGFFSLLVLLRFLPQERTAGKWFLQGGSKGFEQDWWVSCAISSFSFLFFGFFVGSKPLIIFFHGGVSLLRASVNISASFLDQSNH